MSDLRNRVSRSLGIIAILGTCSACGGEHMILDSNLNAIPHLSIGNKALGYKSDILAVFQQKCSSCHGPGSPRGDWLDYATAAANKDKIYQRIFVSRDMPMGGQMDDATRELIADWVKEGAPEDKDSAANPIPNPVPTPTLISGPQPSIPTYEGSIKAIIQNRCSMCHNASSPPNMPNWLDYATAAAKKDRIYDRVVVKKDMPLGMSMPDEERALIGAWSQAGAPKNSGSVVNSQPTSSEPSVIPTVISMPESPDSR